MSSSTFTVHNQRNPQHQTFRPSPLGLTVSQQEIPDMPIVVTLVPNSCESHEGCYEFWKTPAGITRLQYLDRVFDISHHAKKRNIQSSQLTRRVSHSVPIIPCTPLVKRPVRDMVSCESYRVPSTPTQSRFITCMTMNDFKPIVHESIVPKVPTKFYNSATGIVS